MPDTRSSLPGPAMAVVDVAPSLELIRLLAQVRACVATHVAARRAAGAPVERVIPEVRRLVREAEAGEGWRDASGALLAQVVGWAVAAYYDEPELRHVPRFY